MQSINVGWALDKSAFLCQAPNGELRKRPTSVRNGYKFHDDECPGCLQVIAFGVARVSRMLTLSIRRRAAELLQFTLWV